MKIRTIAALLLAGLSTSLAFAQSSTPPAPATPPVPAVPAPPLGQPAVPQTTTAEGTLMKSQRANNDRGKYEWICTYRVEKITRSVLLDESCPQNLPFEIKK